MVFFTKGEKAIPLRYEHAMIWARENLPNLVYRNEFEREKFKFDYDKNNSEKISTIIPKVLADELNYRAKIFKIKKTDIVIDALAHYFRNNPTDHGKAEEIDIK